MRNLTLETEESYDLDNDSLEHNNLVEEIDYKKLIAFLKTQIISSKKFSQKEKETINQRLRALGYIK